MDVYRQASEIIHAVRAGNGTAKALCLRKEMQKKRQTYAVVCETLRHYELLQDVLEQAEFFKYYPNANKNFAMCMAYDIVLGKGVNTNRDSTAQAIQKSASYLREAFWRVKKHHIIPPRLRDSILDDDADNSKDGKSGDSQYLRSATDERDNDGIRTGVSSACSGVLEQRMPRYARVNTLKIDVESLVERLRRAAKHGHDGGAAAPGAGGHADGGKGNHHRSKGFRGLPSFTLDPIVPSLLVFPHGTDLHAHPAVRSGQLVLQDRASCLPACILLDAVEVRKSFSNPKETPLEYIVDACAAPGNKTTQLAALGAPVVKIMSVERDEKRAEILRNRVQTLGAGDYVNVVHMDFFLMSSADREVTEGILLDPSCSASGVLTRVDVSLLQQQCQNRTNDTPKSNKINDKHDNDNNRAYGGAAEGDDDDGDDRGAVGAISVEEHGARFASNVDRVMCLARLQRKLLAHALLSFDRCRTVVYSTCSVHEEENEGVVRQVLEDARVQARGWTLSHIMPTVWQTRGRKAADDTFPLDYTIRCDPATDSTNGFYVARFDRTV